MVDELQPKFIGGDRQARALYLSTFGLVSKFTGDASSFKNSSKPQLKQKPPSLTCREGHTIFRQLYDNRPVKNIQE